MIGQKESNLSFNSKIYQTAGSVINNLEFSIGVGQGFYFEAEIIDIGINAGMYGNYASLHYHDRKWNVGQELFVGVSASAVQWFEVGFGDYSFMQNGQVVDSNTWWVLNDTQDSWTIFSVACYPLFAGGSISVAFDLNTFIGECDDIWNWRKRT